MYTYRQIDEYIKDRYTYILHQIDTGKIWIEKSTRYEQDIFTLFTCKSDRNFQIVQKSFTHEDEQMYRLGICLCFYCAILSQEF